MRRRDFISLLGGATAWPLAARAQQPERIRLIGVLVATAADDPEGQARITAFRQGLRELGWTEGRDVRIDTPPMPISFAPMPQNWSRSRRTLS
jgi:putative ABC transport system substrate-binding protein